MDQYIPWITGSGGALVVLAILAWLMISGKLHSDSEFQSKVKEIEDLKTALETERTVNNELAHAGGVTNKLIGALVDVATDRHAEIADRHRPAKAADRDLTAEDLGLLADAPLEAEAGRHGRHENRRGRAAQRGRGITRAGAQGP